MIAAAEIARQLRLRDMGGIIVVDRYVKSWKSQSVVRFLEEMSDDKAKHKILPQVNLD
jgi:ribonuclease G